MRFLTILILALSLSSFTGAISHAQQAGPEVKVTKLGDGWHFADAKGLALYIYDKDEEPGKSQCKDACAKTWPPFAAGPDAKPLGGWDIIVREDGIHQWTYRGQPVYSYIKDQTPETTFGDGSGAAWHVVFQPISMPPETQMAKSLLGTILTDSKGFTLYTLDDGKTCAGDCLKSWTPLAAPWAAIKNGDWEPIEVADGTKQWSFKGKVLYRYTGDSMPGDTLGHGIGNIWHAAILVPTPPYPSWVTFVESDGGEILADERGHTVYVYNLRRGYKQSPLSETSLQWADKGICDDECKLTDKWIPVPAKPEDKSMGNWTVVTNDKGERQWSFKGNPLYTNGRDAHPGEFRGVNFGDVAWKAVMRNGSNMPATAPG